VVEDDRSCAVSVTSSEPARITAQTSTRCGTTTQPWRLSAPAGQRIALGLLDFARPPATAGDRGPCRAGRRVWHRHIAAIGVQSVTSLELVAEMPPRQLDLTIG